MNRERRPTASTPTGIQPTLPLFAAVGVLALSSAALAQTTITHQSVYTRPVSEDYAPNTSRALTNMPLIDPKQLPPSVLRKHSALPTGPDAPVAGITFGSADGIHLIVPAAPSAYGTFSPLSIAPYTTARASATIKGPGSTADSVAVTSFPWRATGRLSFLIGGSEYVCSASMIGPGLLVTAAHCVYTFGTNSSAGWHTDFVYTPALYDPNLPVPYGNWTFTSETIATSYYNGSDTCYQTGVVCNNDIAVVAVTPKRGAQVGNTTGWYSYGWNGYSYVSSFGGASLASITQLGYPVAFDNGELMERTDGIGGFWATGNLHNTVLGSAMTGGSSGGPWLVNFGAVPVLSTSASLGNAAGANVVVGVTSWGYTTVGTNTQGASFFGQDVEFPNASYSDSHGFNRGAGNIGALVAAVCSGFITNC
jgi:V8-like Glu-specific endopeptidase